MAHDEQARADQPPDDSATGPSDAPPAALSRRAILTGAASLAGLTAAQAVLSSLNAAPLSSPGLEDPARIPGRQPTPYGQRSTFERTTRLAGATSSLTPLQALHGIVTPSALHFERHHNGVPVIEPARHRLLVHGLVEQPMTFTLEEIKRFPARSRLAFIECSGNSGGEWHTPAGRTVQETHGLFSTSEWTGVPLALLLREVGAKPEATWMLAEGSDAALMARSIPLARALEEALICYAQNGEALRPEQGYPLRLLLPGWEGNANIKWLRRLKLGQAPFMTRDETSHYTDLMPDGTARQFTFDMDAKSVITSPSGGQQVRAGFVEIRGLAWSGRGRITRADVSTDGGHTWHQAQLEDPVLPKCATAFRFPWRWDGQEAMLQSRCTDETGYAQPTRQALVAVRGINSSYHYNAIQTWLVTMDGAVRNVHV
ncbi:MAG: sulfite dehydrogenase [Nitrospirae bacterium]|nr:MAG: sulfite dehydrogenase [Nitrospirota bacterium]